MIAIEAPVTEEESAEAIHLDYTPKEPGGSDRTESRFAFLSPPARAFDPLVPQEEHGPKFLHDLRDRATQSSFITPTGSELDTTANKTNIYPNGRAAITHTDSVQNNTKKCVVARVLEKVGGGFLYSDHNKFGLIVVWIPIGAALLMLSEAMSISHRAERLKRLPLGKTVPTHLTFTHYCYTSKQLSRSVTQSLLLMSYSFLLFMQYRYCFIPFGSAL